MNDKHTTPHCHRCGKELSPEGIQRIGFQKEGEPEVVHDFCYPCAERIARAVVSIERGDHLKGELLA